MYITFNSTEGNGTIGDGLNGKPIDMEGPIPPDGNLTTPPQDSPDGNLTSPPKPELEGPIPPDENLTTLPDNLEWNLTNPEWNLTNPEWNLTDPEFPVYLPFPLPLNNDTNNTELPLYQNPVPINDPLDDFLPEESPPPPAGEEEGDGTNPNTPPPAPGRNRPPRAPRPPRPPKPPRYVRAKTIGLRRGSIAKEALADPKRAKKAERIAAKSKMSQEALGQLLEQDQELAVDFLHEQLVYICESAVLDGPPAVEETPVFADAVDPPTTEAFLLHSRPGAARTIYLDFNGESWSTV
jgi:hypothetical protein